MHKRLKDGKKERKSINKSKLNGIHYSHALLLLFANVGVASILIQICTTIENLVNTVVYKDCFSAKNYVWRNLGCLKQKSLWSHSRWWKFISDKIPFINFSMQLKQSLLLQLKCFHMDYKLPFYCNNNDNSYCRGNSSKMLKVFSSVILLCILMWLFTRCQG